MSIQYMGNFDCCSYSTELYDPRERFEGISSVTTQVQHAVRVPASSAPSPEPHMGFPKIRGTILGVLTLRIVVYWGLYWGPLILGKHHIIGLFLDLAQPFKGTEGYPQF